MQGKFDFLEELSPKLALYGRKAEEALNSDNNVCLFYLARIAETIIKKLSHTNHIEGQENLTASETLEELTRLGAVDENAARKIITLLEVKNDVLMNCERLITVAQELCEWFILKHCESKFSFMADLFLPDRFIPPLANLAEIGREAEENLSTNARYCLICLGDMGEAIVDYLMNINNIETHERDQMYRIDILFKNYVITDEIKDALHELRIARNKAVHERYDNTYTSEEECKRLLDEVLKLCEWLFKLVLKPGYIVKGRISEINENSVSVLLGEIPALADNDRTIENSYAAGKKYIFKIVEKKGDNITLRFDDENYIDDVIRRYSKYKIGQTVRVLIKRISNSSGALVELKDGLLACIPPSEIGRRLYDYDDANKKQIKYEVLARVKWFSRTQFPPMLLSVKDIENEKEHSRLPEPSTWEQPKQKQSISDLDFITLVKNASLEKVLEALDRGANPNAKNKNKTTALMYASQFNQDKRVIEALLDAKAELEARNHNGNTALHFAAMQNTPAVIKLLIEKGADIEALNHDKKTPLDYARSNKSLNDTEIIDLLTPDSEKTDDKKPVKKVSDVSPVDNINKRLLDVCKSGTAQEILTIIENGANVNTLSSKNTTPLMTAAQYNKIDAVQVLLEHGADVNSANKEGNTALYFAAGYNTPEVVTALINAGVEDINAKNKMGNTPLHFAAGYNSAQVVETLIKAGADTEMTNEKGKTPLDLAKKKPNLQGTEALKLLFSRDFLKICASGTEKEILEAINAGVNVNSKNNALSTALMFAAKDNTAEAVNILINSGAHVNMQDVHGNTALIYAAYYNNEDVVETLLDAGADISVANTSGNLAYDYGKKNYRLADTETLKKLKMP